MTESREGADRVGHGEASLGDAQSSNPPDDPDMIYEDAAPLDADTELDAARPQGDDERDVEDPAPNAP